MSKPSITSDVFLELAIQQHGSKYVYYICTDLVKSHQKIKIKCPTHGEFFQKAFHHINGAGCKKCGIAARSGFNSVEWKRKAANIPSSLTNYKWIDCNTIEVTCDVHGTNNFSYYRVMTAKCNPCCKITPNRKKPFYHYKNILTELYHEKYQYNVDSFNGVHHPMEIICPHHGPFTVSSLLSHLRGTGCPRCKPRSTLEIEWLDTLGIPECFRNKKIVINDNVYFADAYDPTTNTIYEFWGDYYHGNPKKFQADGLNKTCNKTFGELYNYTLNKIKTITDAGYTLIEIWESDFVDQKNNGD